MSYITSGHVSGHRLWKPSAGSEGASTGALRAALSHRCGAVITWTAPANATSYQVHISKRNTTKKWKSWTTASTPTLRVTGLKRGATYRVQIIPSGPGGSGASGVWRFKQRK